MAKTLQELQREKDLEMQLRQAQAQEKMAYAQIAEVAGPSIKRVGDWFGVQETEKK